MANNNFDLLKELDDNKSELTSFINSSSKTILDEEIKARTTLINQLRGYFSQILVRVQDYLPKEEFTNYINFQDRIIKEISSLDNSDNTKSKLDSLNKIYSELINTYNTLNNRTLTIIENDNPVIKYNNAVKKANEVILSLNSIELSKSLIEPLLPLYDEIKTTKDITLINSFINKGREILSNNNSNINAKLGMENERVFSLFAKINDQIIDSCYINNNNLIYALYTLEDSSSYYAVIKEEKEIEILNQSFSNLPNLVLTKDNIINTCKIIINNAGIYYDINEYMRYIEKSYKGKMTKEIDDVILKYKTRLQELENILTTQLSFIDDIALLVNHKPCNKYPNITYNDVSINEYFPNYNEEKDSKLKEIEHLIIEVLLNPNMKSEFNTKSILKTLYDTNTLSSLASSNYVKEDNIPIVNTSDNISNELEVTGNIKTNYDKIKDYLNMRVEELKLLESSPKINVTITKDENNIFKDINTVLDLSTAISICNKVYKKGQGEYAVIDYLKTGNTLKFTSKYKARDLASSAPRNNYLKLLLENIFKRYLYQKDNKDFVDDILSIDSISIKDIVSSLLTNDNLLVDVITNYDYEYLDSLSIKSKKIEELLNNKNDLMIVKINKILEDIKRIEKIILDI